MKINYSNSLLRICEHSIFDSTIKRNENGNYQHKTTVNFRKIRLQGFIDQNQKT